MEEHRLESESTVRVNLLPMALLRGHKSGNLPILQAETLDRPIGKYKFSLAARKQSCSRNEPREGAPDRL